MKGKTRKYKFSDQLNLHVVVGLYRSYLRLSRSTQKLMAGYKLTEPQFGVLEALYHLGDMKIGDIINKTLSTSGNMTVVIRNLEQEGWVTRLRDPIDRRAHLVQLTPKGNALMASIFPEHLTELARLLGNLDAEEKQQLIALLKKLNNV